MGSGYPVVWVESPVQFVAAAELAAARGRRLRVTFRLGAQMPETAAELLDRGALFASCQPYVGIPWGELRGADEWIVGDGLSGQFQLAAALLRPSAVTLLDDGTMSLRLAAALAGLAPYERTERPASGMRALLAVLTRDHLLRLAGRGDLEFFSMYGAERPEFVAAAAHGVRLRANDFAWTRRTARPPRLPVTRVLLGTARVVDGLLGRDDHLAEVARRAAEGSLVYLPHRRESEADLARIAAVPGVGVLRTGLPVELFLAGLDGVEVLAGASSAADTLARILGTRERAA